jgi:CTP:molybdopterin cytidylyltransferase MocA
MTARKDWAIVLARGDSLRMGKPKGLCALPDDRLNFLQRVIALYQQVGFPVAVVTTPELESEYSGALADLLPDRWIVTDPGLGTARSVAVALEALADQATHLWLHPVDLPSVNVYTISELLVHSREIGGAVFVPEYGGQPGHPVVLPVAPFADLAGYQVPGSMREVILKRCAENVAESVPLFPVPLTDDGVVCDYDDPSSLDE